MKIYTIYAQLYLRIAIGLGYLLAFADRLGWLGASGPNIAWGNWSAFLDYTHILLHFLPRGASDALGLLATIAEGLLGCLLMVGYKTRSAAIGSFVLGLTFALCMTFALGFKSVFNYSVLTLSAASLLLAALPCYSWSIDNLFRPKRKKIF